MSNAISERPEAYYRIEERGFGVVEKPLSAWERIAGNEAIRKAALLLALAGIWELYAALLSQPLLFPRFSTTALAFYRGIVDGVILERSWDSIVVLAQGYMIGLALAALVTALAVTTRFGRDLLELLTSMFNPLPAIALLPLALIWFGLGNASLVFVLVHSVLWAIALNTQSGFLAVSQTLRMVGRNYGLRGARFVALLLIPAAFPSILTGMKIGWAFAWRTLIASELVFGVSSGSGGLGWYIYENKNVLKIPNVFAGLFSVILIGLFVENVVFKTIEAQTVRKWGMQI